MRGAIQWQLPSGLLVVLAELSVAELLTVRRGVQGDGDSVDLAYRQTGAQTAIRKVGDEDVTYDQVIGRGWDARFKTRDSLALCQCFARMHGATVDEVAAAKASAAVTVAGDITETTVTLDDGRRVSMRELPFDAFRASIAAADKEPTTAARVYASALDGLRRSIVRIDDGPPTWPADPIAAWPFSARQTDTLLAVWRDVHGLDGAAVDPTMVSST